jgi:malonate transporter and related proteins
VHEAALLLPDFLLIALGVALARLPAFPTHFWSGVERLVYYVLFPALLFRSLAGSPLALGDAGRLVGVGIGFTLAGMALSALAIPLFRLPHATFASCFQCAFRFNTYVALAAANRVAGAAGVAAISLLVGVLVPLVNIAAVAMLVHGRDSRVVPALVRNPLVIACAIGIAWNATRVPIPALPSRILELLAAAALPLGLLAVGAGLRFTRGTLPLPALAWWQAIKLGVLPAIAYALANLAGLTATERQVAVIMAAVPTATSAYILAVQMNGAGAPVALLISTGTLLAAVTLPLWLSLL